MPWCDIITERCIQFLNPLPPHNSLEENRDGGVLAALVKLSRMAAQLSRDLKLLNDVKVGRSSDFRSRANLMGYACHCARLPPHELLNDSECANNLPFISAQFRFSRFGRGLGKSHL